MGKRASPKQFKLMVDYIENNRVLLSNDGSLKKEEIANKWNELADILNAEPSGVCKTGEKWKKSFQDWKSYVKKKAAIRFKEMNKTGNQGQPDFEPLTDLEDRLHFLTGRIAAEGEKSVYESEIIVNDSEIFNSNAENENENPEDEILVYDVTPSTKSAAELFDRNCSRDKFKKRRMTITEELSNKLIRSQEGQIAERQRLADVAELELQIATRRLRLKHQKLMYKLRLNKLKYL